MVAPTCGSAWGARPQSYATPTRARTRGQAIASLSQPQGPGLARQAALSSARCPQASRAPPQGRWPRTASSSSQEWTPLRGLESCLLSWGTAPDGSLGKGTAGCSWEPRLHPPTYCTGAHAKAPPPAQTTAQPKGGQEAAPGRAVRSWVPGQRHSYRAACDPKGQSTKVRPRAEVKQL